VKPVSKKSLEIVDFALDIRRPIFKNSTQQDGMPASKDLQLVPLA
jgi:hypothetical protein